MCGITAVLSSSGAVSTDTLHRGTAALHHRGPDGRGHWISPDCRVGLGHTRLSIIDLSTGAQPIANEDESLWIVANGEFYDFEQIRENLRRRGHSFRTGSDSEIALHLYEDLGPECLHQLRGRVCLRHLGRAEPAALCRSRSLRGQAVVLRGARRRALPRLRGEGALCHGHPGALERRGGVCRWLHRAGRANPVSRRACRPARPLPARHHRGPPAPSVLGHRLSRRRHGAGRTLRARVRAGIPRGAGGIGEDPAPRRRAGRLLPERGNRFLCRTRSRGAAPQRAGARLHPHV